MSDNQKKSGDPEEQNVATLGGSTAQAEGTGYQMISEPAKEAAEAIGEASEGVSAGPTYRADTGRDPEAYAGKQSAGSTGGEMADKPFDIQGEVGRQKIAQPNAGEPHTEKGT